MAMNRLLRFSRCRSLPLRRAEDLFDTRTHPGTTIGVGRMLRREIMSRRLRLGSFAVLLVLAVCPVPRSSHAATLTLGQDAHSYFPNWFDLFGAGVTASDGSTPIAPVPYGPRTPAIPASGGSMSLDYINGGSQVQVRFSVSLFSDANPFIQTGTWGPSAIPVTLRIDQISY